ncbi:proline racemase family protein [Paenibacillus alba]|uniref:PrpF domain-containing protein n=1 Tax=Paenibacillus alba TaxID=1197127 RepID=UPI001563DA25|nr:PrpF domain-containing protein [Paenibacillus alba]NQX71156.1 proline racemase family protein [Paenibacillus alba]
MLTYLAHAEGSVSSSIIIDGSELGTNPIDVIPVLHRIHTDLDDSQHPHGLISKFVVIRPSTHPMYDLSYWFFQLVPGNPVSFDYEGSCGHSILAAIQVAMKWGWVASASPGLRVRVYIENVGDSLVCEVDHAVRAGMTCTAHFIENQGTSLGSLLPSGQVRNDLQTSFGEIEVSIVSSGNSYVFVHAESLGIYSEEALFEAGADLLARLQEIRQAAALKLGWKPDGVFPKIAAVASYQPGSLSFRAISVPSWHPTIALTGAACVGAAASMKGSVVYGIVQASKSSTYRLNVRTKGGNTIISTSTTGPELDDYLLYNSISDKNVRLIGSLPLKKGAAREWELQSKVFA